jgi:hypothetical protein
MEMGIRFMNYGQELLCKGIISAVKRVEVVGDRMSYIIQGLSKRMPGFRHT